MDVIVPVRETVPRRRKGDLLDGGEGFDEVVEDDEEEGGVGVVVVDDELGVES